MNVRPFRHTRLWCATLLSFPLLLGSVSVSADLAPIQDQGVLVERNPDPQDPATVASYVSSGGWAVTGADFLDKATYVFDFAATTSVSQATLRLPVESVFAQNGSSPLEITFFSDDGLIVAADYGLGFSTPIVQLEGAGQTTLEIDVTGPVNASLQAGQYVGFKINSTVEPGSVDTEKNPPYTGPEVTE